MADVALEPQTAALTDTAWNRVTADLIDLLADGEGGEFRPTRYAALYLWHLLAALGPQMGATFLYGYVSTDGDGGLRVHWQQNTRDVSVQIFAVGDKKHYVYHEAGDDYGSEDLTSVAVLTRWLNWLIAT
ncbi:MAG: hypothetical protein M3Z04_15610 [Chloroflexota bacterium]|nr:hypothetical protein [Chloroflexota bacterium]